MLVLTSFLLMGSYYCYDNPGGCYKNLASWFWDEDKFDYYFDMLYSVYSLPNIVLTMVGGVLVDRTGVCFSISLFAGLILIGQVCHTTAAQPSLPPDAECVERSTRAPARVLQAAPAKLDPTHPRRCTADRDGVGLPAPLAARDAAGPRHLWAWRGVDFGGAVGDDHAGAARARVVDPAAES